MLLQVAERRKVLVAVVAVERLTIVQPQMGTQTIPCVKGLLATVFWAFEGFLFRVHSNMNLQTVRGEEGFSTTVLGAFKAVFAWNCRKQLC